MRHLISELNPADRQEFVRRARRRAFRAGDTVFWQGDPGDALHLVARGAFAASVSTPVAQTIIVNVFRKDDAFGELALLGAEPRRNATVVALERGETLSVTTEQFEEWRAERPHIERLLVRALAERVSEMTEQLLESLYVPVDTRVLRRLVSLHNAMALASGDGWIHIRQEDFAAYCGVTRPTVNRVLRQLVARGMVELERGRLRVCDITAMVEESRRS